MGDWGGFHDVTPRREGPCDAHAGGFDLDAGLMVRAGHRDRLERLCRYALRPPLSQERLNLAREGEIWLALRHRRADGTTHVTLLGLPSDAPEPRPAWAPPRHLDFTDDPSQDAPAFDAAW